MFPDCHNDRRPWLGASRPSRRVPVTVENIPGAGGSVGAERVAKSAPDGSTFYWGANGAMTINPSLQPSPTFDPVRDLAPIARVLVMPSILAVNNEVPAKTVAELFALAKAQPGKLSFASPGVRAATPTECVPFLGIAVSSITSTASLPPTSLSACTSSSVSTGVASQTPAAMK